MMHRWWVFMGFPDLWCLIFELYSLGFLQKPQSFQGFVEEEHVPGRDAGGKSQDRLDSARKGSWDVVSLHQPPRAGSSQPSTANMVWILAKVTPRFHNDPTSGRQPPLSCGSKRVKLPVFLGRLDTNTSRPSGSQIFITELYMTKSGCTPDLAARPG